MKNSVVADTIDHLRRDRDRRVVHIQLTDNGRALVEKSPEVVQGLLVKGLEQLDKQQLEKLLRVWEKS